MNIKGPAKHTMAGVDILQQQCDAFLQLPPHSVDSAVPLSYMQLAGRSKPTICLIR